MRINDSLLMNVNNSLIYLVNIEQLKNKRSWTKRRISLSKKKFHSVPPESTKRIVNYFLCPIQLFNLKGFELTFLSITTIPSLTKMYSNFLKLLQTKISAFNWVSKKKKKKKSLLYWKIKHLMSLGYKNITINIIISCQL